MYRLELNRYVIYTDVSYITASDWLLSCYCMHAHTRANELRVSGVWGIALLDVLETKCLEQHRYAYRL